ncbi:MAG TPA: hypothetical protein VF251_07815, partial [Pyrinomonadaceae bacterium]
MCRTSGQPRRAAPTFLQQEPGKFCALAIAATWKRSRSFASAQNFFLKLVCSEDLNASTDC